MEANFSLPEERNHAHTEKIKINYAKTCNCPENHLNCLTAKEWLKHQIGVWRFSYDKYDIRDKNIHPAVFPVSLAKSVISLFTHEGELVLDPFVGIGTTLVAAKLLKRNAVGFDLQKRYLEFALERLKNIDAENNNTEQIVIQDDARNAPLYLEENTVSLIFTSPPYANLLNRKRYNKSRRFRKNEQYGKIEQYSQDSRDLGILDLEQYILAIGEIFYGLLPILRNSGHCVINVADTWVENKRVALHIYITEELQKRGYELKNIIIWDRTNLVNKAGIFGWPKNYITMGTTYEFILDFIKK